MLDDSVLELGFRLLLLIAYCMRPLCRSPSRLAHACTAHWGLRGWRLEVQIEHMHPYNIPCNLYTDIYIYMSTYCLTPDMPCVPRFHSVQHLHPADSASLPRRSKQLLEWPLVAPQARSLPWASGWSCNCVRLWPSALLHGHCRRGRFYDVIPRSQWSNFLNPRKSYQSLVLKSTISHYIQVFGPKKYDQPLSTSLWS